MFASRKRARDDKEEDYEECARVIKQCRLPFRTSPTTKHNKGFSQSSRSKPPPLFTQTITPADSSEEETSPPYPSSNHSLQPQRHSPLRTSSLSNIFDQSYDMEMDMADSQPPSSTRYLGQNTAMSSPRPSPCTISSPPPTFRDPFKASQNTISGGRLPTPIYGHFQQSIDAKMDMGEDSENVIPRTQQEIEYEKYARRRRLPTPIDEDEVMDSSMTIGHLQMDTEHYYGHPVSKTTTHISQPRTPRLSFSMGIRADCELCRMKVPGHSNHIFKA